MNKQPNIQDRLMDFKERIPSFMESLLEDANLNFITLEDLTLPLEVDEPTDPDLYELELLLAEYKKLHNFYSKADKLDTPEVKLTLGRLLAAVGIHLTEPLSDEYLTYWFLAINLRRYECRKVAEDFRGWMRQELQALPKLDISILHPLVQQRGFIIDPASALPLKLQKPTRYEAYFERLITDLLVEDTQDEDSEDIWVDYNPFLKNSFKDFMVIPNYISCFREEFCLRFKLLETSVKEKMMKVVGAVVDDYIYDYLRLFDEFDIYRQKLVYTYELLQTTLVLGDLNVSLPPSPNDRSLILNGSACTYFVYQTSRQVYYLISVLDDEAGLTSCGTKFLQGEPDSDPTDGKVSFKLSGESFTLQDVNRLIDKDLQK